ncbi:MAG: DinB family protein [Phycisphaerales bacterium JB064]
MLPQTTHVLKTYDYLVKARERLFAQARPLTPRQHAEVFEIGLGSLLRTFAHISGAEWYYIQRLTGAELPPMDQWPIMDEKPPALPVIEAMWLEQAGKTRAALAAVGDWGAEVSYEVTLSKTEGERPRRVIATAADMFTQLVMHEVHHRAQAMNILRHLGVAVEDVDYNEMMYRFEDL